MVPTNTIVGGGTGSAATDIIGVRGTRSYDMRDTSLETAVDGDVSGAALGSGSNVTTRDTRYYRNRVSSASIRHFQSVGIIINNDDSKNSELFLNSELDFRTNALAKIIDWEGDHSKV